MEISKIKLINIKKVYSTNTTFIACREDDEIIIWGGGEDPISNKLNNIKELLSYKNNFIALENNGNVFNSSFDYYIYAAIEYDSNEIIILEKTLFYSKLKNILKIYSTEFGFAAITIDGNMLIWGDIINEFRWN